MKYHAVRRFYAASLMAMLLTACQSTPSGDTGQAFYRAPDGTRLILKRDITIPADRVKTYFQNGSQVVGVNQYEPFCRFEIRSLAGTPRVVKADEFLIKRSGKITTEIVENEAEAMRPRFRLVGLSDENPMIYGITMFLQSAAQPDVYRMICGHLQDPLLGARGPTLAQIRAALGDTFALSVP